MPVRIEKRQPKRPSKDAESIDGLPKDADLHSKEHPLASVPKDKLESLQKYINTLMAHSLQLLGTGDEHSAETEHKTLRSGLASLVEEYNGVVELTVKQKLLDDEWKKGKPTAPPPVNPQITKSHIENGVAYMANTITADNGIWSGQANKANQPKANAIAARLKRDSEQFDHRTALTDAFRKGFIGNLGGVFLEWVDEPMLSQSIGMDGMVIDTPSLYSGNKLICADPFNLILDARVQPSKVYCDGEYAGRIELVPRVTVYDRLRSGVWRLPDGKEYNPYDNAGDNGDYYVPPKCQLDSMYADAVTTFYLKGYPKAWGLPAEDGLAVWKFTLLGSDHTIVDAEPIASTFIPFAGFCVDPATAYNCDGGLVAQLMPFQRFIAYIFSGYQCSLMKNINGGVVAVTDDVFDIQNTSDAAMVGGIVKANKANGEGRLSDEYAILSAPAALQTIPADINLALELMQRIFPTDMLKQITSLERATQYQAAATVQAGNKRNVLIAGLIDSQMMAPLRQMMVDNVLRNCATLDMVNPDNGELEATPISAFIGLDLRYTIADGLSGLDNLGSAEAMQQCINTLIQMPQAAQNVDLFSALNFILQKRGANVDFTQFRIGQQMPALPAAGEGMAQPSGEPVMPDAGAVPMSPEQLLLNQLGGAG